MKRTPFGYTLIELIITIALLVIVLTGGTAIFYRSFRSSGLSDLQTTVNSGVKSLGDSIERTLKYGVVSRVNDGGEDMDRNDCLLAGEEGVVGDGITIKNFTGGGATYDLLVDGTVSSNSGVISNTGIFVTKLQFTWRCTSGVNDKMNLVIEATPNPQTEEGFVGVLNRDINLLNSGVN